MAMVLLVAVSATSETCILVLEVKDMKHTIVNIILYMLLHKSSK